MSRGKKSLILSDDRKQLIWGACEHIDRDHRYRFRKERNKAVTLAVNATQTNYEVLVRNTFTTGAALNLSRSFTERLGWLCCIHLHLDGQAASMAWLGFGRTDLTEGCKKRNISKR